MKDILNLSLLIAAFAIIGCTEETTTKPQEDVSEQQPPMINLENVHKPILFDYTSTGCPGCGSWGGPTFESIIDEEKSAIVPVAVHIKYGDNMITDVSNALAENRTGQYFTPQLWVNNTNGVLLSGGRINGAGSLEKLNTEIDEVQNSSSEMQLGVSHIVNDDKVLIRYKLKANEDLDGQYFVGVYLMENGINDRQSGNPNGSKNHNHVIRTSNSGGFGTPISADELVKGTESEAIVEMDKEDDWNMKNLYATIIVWKTVGSNYFVVNANNDLIQ